MHFLLGNDIVCEFEEQHNIINRANERLEVLQHLACEFRRGRCVIKNAEDRAQRVVVFTLDKLVEIIEQKFCVIFFCRWEGHLSFLFRYDGLLFLLVDLRESSFN